MDSIIPRDDCVMSILQLMNSYDNKSVLLYHRSIYTTKGTMRGLEIYFTKTFFLLVSLVRLIR